MENQIVDSLIEAMKIMFDNDTEDTYECSILKRLNNTGGYELDYMSNKIVAYAMDSSKIYSPGDLVYVIAPSGDFNDIKYILGPARPSSENFNPPSPSEDEEDTIYITDDLLDVDTPKDIFGLKSYESINDKDITLGVCDKTRFIEKISNYIKGKRKRALQFEVDIKTSLDMEQILSDGEYGISISLPFVDGFRTYELNSPQMKGSPMSFLNWAHQSLEITIDEEEIYDITRMPIVRIYKKNFIENESKVKEEFDIQFRNISLRISNTLSEEEYQNYYVYLYADGGEYFLKDDSIDAKKQIHVSLRNKGMDIDISDDEIYWFESDPEVSLDSEFYSEYGGFGWKRLNPKSGPAASHMEFIEVAAKDVHKEKRFKCVIIRDGISYLNEITIYKDERDFDIILESSEGEEISVFSSSVVLKLKFYYKGLTNNLDYKDKVYYNWTKENRIGQIDSKFEDSLYIISQNEEIEEINGKAYYITEIEFPSSMIDQVAIIKAGIHVRGKIPGIQDFKQNKDYFVGDAEILLTITEEEIEDSLPKLLYDYNTREIKIKQSADMIASISCNVLEKIDIEGHLLVHYVATEYSDVILRFFDNDVAELFAPVIFKAKPGRNTIGVPHAYLKRLEGIHNFTITCQCTNGELTIPIRNVLFTIDSGRMAERLIDAGMDVQDIAFKHVSLSPKPEEIWAIGVEDNGLILKKADYNIRTEIAWEAVHFFKDGALGAIEFPGSWKEQESSEKYTIKTDKVPYVGIIDEEKNLCVYYGDNFENKQAIDTEVSQVALRQGFNSSAFPEQDQGLVLVYIKNGNVYYRQKLYGDLTFTGSIALYEQGDAIDINIHRLPDYRLGICVSYSGGTKWYITERTYVGQAVKTQRCTISSDQITDIAVVGTDHLEEAVDTPTIKTLTPDERWHTQIVLTFASPLTFIRGASKQKLADSIVAKVDGKVKELADISIEGNEILLTFAEKFAGGLLVEVSGNCPGTMLLLYNGCRTSVIVKASFTPPLPIKTFSLGVYEHKDIKIFAVTQKTIIGEMTTSLFDKNIEKSVVDITSKFTISVGQMMTKEESSSEKATVGIQATTLVEVAQTGTSPV